MDIKQEYREKFNKDVFSDECCMQPSASYSDEYVRWLEQQVKNCSIPDVVESAELEANDEQGTPIVNEDGSMTCNCVDPKQSRFPNGKWICTKCWGEWYH